MHLYDLFQNFEHIGLGAVNTTILANWYCDVFGMKIVYQTQSEMPIYFLAHPNTEFKIEIFPMDHDIINEEKAIHFCLKVQDIDKAIEYLSTKGIECSSIKKLMQNGRTIFLKDPAGHVLQIVERPIVLWS